MPHYLLVASLATVAPYATTSWYNTIWGMLLLMAGFSLLMAAIAQIARFRRERSWRGRANEPLQILALQIRLGRLAAEVRRLERSNEMGRGHHIRAAESAYDELLAEACRKAGITPEDEMVNALTTKSAFTQPDVASRLGLELALAARGWEW